MGRPKAWLPFGPETLLERVVRVVGEAVRPVVVVAAPGQDLPPLPRAVSIVRDEEEGRGPLQGIAAGLQALARLPHPVDAAYISSCDVPFLRPAFVTRLLQLLDGYDICVPYVDGRHHPLAAVYRLHVIGQVRELLAARRLRPFYLFEKVSTRIVEAHELVDVDPTCESLRNVNTPEEYAKALEFQGAVH